MLELCARYRARASFNAPPWFWSEPGMRGLRSDDQTLIQDLVLRGLRNMEPPKQAQGEASR